jgi:hypothetical protein
MATEPPRDGGGEERGPTAAFPALWSPQNCAARFSLFSGRFVSAPLRTSSGSAP